MAEAENKGQRGNFFPDDLDVLEQKLNQDPDLLWGDGGLLVRRSLRVPCRDQEAATVKVGGVSFELLNIGSHGLGLLVAEHGVFFVGEELPRIELVVREQAFSLRGEVVHVTPAGDGRFCCGIRLQQITPDQEKMIRCLLLAQQALAAAAGHEME